MISLTKRWNGNFLISKSVDFLYFLISLSAMVPGLNLLCLITPWVRVGTDLRDTFCATSIFLGAFIAVVFLAVCFVLAIINDNCVQIAAFISPSEHLNCSFCGLLSSYPLCF